MDVSARVGPAARARRDCRRVQMSRLPLGACAGLACMSQGTGQHAQRCSTPASRERIQAALRSFEVKIASSLPAGSASSYQVDSVQGLP